MPAKPPCSDEQLLRVLAEIMPIFMEACPKMKPEDVVSIDAHTLMYLLIATTRFKIIKQQEEQMPDRLFEKLYCEN
jgi:hypothetical protein